MTSWALYIIKFSISLSLIYLFYQVFLRRLTFYRLNRWYLLIYSLFCFLIPLIHIDKAMTVEAEKMPLIRYIPVMPFVQTAPQQSFIPSVQPTFPWPNLIAAIMVTGSLILFMRLLIQFYSLNRLKKRSSFRYVADVRICEPDEEILPFSFGKTIYLKRDLYSEDALNDIIAHEYAHVKQKHWVDMIWGECLCIINWYNPFAWLMRHAIRQNLEFLADDAVLKKGLDKKNYQYHLLTLSGPPTYGIASRFNLSSLKNRILMMNRIRSARVHLLRLFFLVPLALVLLLAFRGNEPGQRPGVISNYASPLPITIKAERDTIPVEAYVDDVEVHNGIMQWSLSRWLPDKPFYLLDGKPAGRDFEKLNLNNDQVYLTEVAMTRALSKKFAGDSMSVIVNLVTLKNKSDKGAYIFTKQGGPAPGYQLEMMKEARTRNVLYIGIDHPMHISAEGIADEDLVIKMDEAFGYSYLQNNLYHIKPLQPGNAPISIYKKEKDGSLRLLNTRYFRIENFPIPVMPVHPS